MTNRRVLILALLVWLTAAAIIVGRSLELMFTAGFLGSSWPHVPMATIDGQPAYTMQSTDSSKAGGAWKRHRYHMIPENQLPPGDADRSLYWEAIAIDQPFHLTFRKPDGTKTGPHRVAFRERGYAEWAPDGMSWQFHSGSSDVVRRPFRPEGRQWNAAVVHDVAMEQLAYILYVGVLVAVVAGTICVLSNALRKPPQNVCAACGYDLRGNAAPGCPECGEGRTG